MKLSLSQVRHAVCFALLVPVITLSVATAHAEDDYYTFKQEPEIGQLDSDSLSKEFSSIKGNNNTRSLSRVNYISNGSSTLSYTKPFSYSSEEDEGASLSERPYEDGDAGDLLATDPTPGARMTSTFGPRVMGKNRFHYGVDLAAPTGTPIYAAGNGVVTFAGPMRGYGRMIQIDHGNGYTTRYGHPSRVYVQVGDQVTKNQEIAAVGCAGRCTGPHLHYEVRKNGRPVNPATYIAMAQARD